MLGNPLLLAVNKILCFNPSSQNLLKHHQGKSFQLNISGIKLAAQIDNDGLLIPPSQQPFNVIITISVASLTYLFNQDKLLAIKSITFNGNKPWGLELLEIFSHLHLAGIYSSSPLNNFMLNRLISLFNLIKNQMQLMTSNLASSVTEYLLYETQDLANPFEIDRFCNEVDELKSRLELLNQQINLLAIKPL